MGRTIIPDSKFNKEEFAHLLNVARGEQTRHDFSLACKMSPSYYSKYINERMDNPPLPQTLWKIAVQAVNDVTYEDLLKAAGYDPEKYSRKNMESLPNIDIISSPDKPDSASWPRISRLLAGTIVSYLTECDFPWKIISSHKEGRYFDFSIDIEDDILKKWHFEYRAKPKWHSEDKGAFHCYGFIASMEYEPSTKISIVTDNVEVYEAFNEYPPQMLPVYVSLILIDLNNLTIINEKYLPTAIKVPDELYDTYMLCKSNQ